MASDWQTRHDLDKVARLASELDRVLSESNVDSLKELLGQYYDQSEVDIVSAKLTTDLNAVSTSFSNLNSALIDFNAELIGFDEDNNNLSSDLSKLKDNLHTFIGAVNTLTGDLSDLDSSLDGLSDDIFGENGLDSNLSALSAVVGDSNGGLVKGLADLGTSLSQLSRDVGGLGSSVNGLISTVGDEDSGLVKGLNDLNDDVFGEGGLSDDIFGEDGLSDQLSALDSAINDNNTGLAVQVNGLDNRVFGTGGLSDSIFGTNGLASRITTAEGGLSELVDSLNVLSDFLSVFEDELGDFEDELAENNIDSSELNSVIVSLVGAITIVKSNVSTVEGNLDDVSDSFDNVKSNLYGTKTVNGETVPKEPTDTASSDSLRGHLTTLKDTTVPAVQTTLYGGGNNSPTNPSANSVIGKANAVKADLYGTKTVNGQTVPKEPSDTASSNSLSGHLTTLKDTTIPAVQVEIFGADNQGNPLNSTNYSDSSLLGRADTVNEDIYGDGENKEGVLSEINTMQTVTIPAVDGVAQSAKSSVNTVKSDLYGTKTVNGQTVPREPTDTAGTGSVKANLNKVKDTDIPTLNNIAYGGENGTGTLANPAEGSLLGDVYDVDTGLGKAHTHIGNLQTQMYGGGDNSFASPTSTSVKGLIDTANGAIADVQGDIGTVPSGQTLQGQIDDLGEGIEEYSYSHSHFLNNVVRLFPLIAEETSLPIKEGTLREVPDDYPYLYAYVNRSHTYNGQTVNSERYYQVELDSNLKYLWTPMQQVADAFIDSELYVWISLWFLQQNELIPSNQIIDNSNYTNIDKYPYYDDFNPLTQKHWNTKINERLGEKSRADSSDYVLVYEPSMATNGISIKVYANDYEVYIKYSGAPISGIANNSSLIIDVIPNNYRPISGYEYNLISHNAPNIIGAVIDSGAVYIINRSGSSYSGTVYGSVRYPRKSLFDVVRFLDLWGDDDIIQKGDTTEFTIFAHDKNMNDITNKTILLFADDHKGDDSYGNSNGM